MTYQAYFGETVRIACLVRSWPSLGITHDNPQMALKTIGGNIVVKAQVGSQEQSESELRIFAQKHYLVIN